MPCLCCCTSWLHNCCMVFSVPSYCGLLFCLSETLSLFPSCSTWYTVSSVVEDCSQSLHVFLSFPLQNLLCHISFTCNRIFVWVTQLDEGLSDVLLFFSTYRVSHELRYSGTSWFKHRLTRTLSNLNTFGEQILTSNPNAASQFAHKHMWRPTPPYHQSADFSTVNTSLYCDSWTAFKSLCPLVAWLTPASNPGHGQTYLLIKIYLTL